MDKNRSELFGQFQYADSLTYEELLAIEDALIAALQGLLSDTGAAHLDFTPLGDALMVQCVYEDYQLDVFRDLASAIAALLPEGVSGRLICLDKSLAGLHVYWMQCGQWQEEERAIPLVPPAGLPTHAVDCVALLPQPEEEAPENPAVESADDLAKETAAETAAAEAAALAAHAEALADSTRLEQAGQGATQNTASQGTSFQGTSFQGTASPSQLAFGQPLARRSAPQAEPAPQQASDCAATDKGTHTTKLH